MENKTMLALDILGEEEWYVTIDGDTEDGLVIAKAIDPYKYRGNFECIAKTSCHAIRGLYKRIYKTDRIAKYVPKSNERKRVVAA